MTDLKINVSSKLPSGKAGVTYVIGCFADDKVVKPLLRNLTSAELKKIDLAALGATGKAEQVVRVPGPQASVIAFVGLGERKPGLDRLREIAGAATRQLRGSSSLVFDFPVANKAEAIAVLEGATLANYDYTAYKSAAKGAPALVKSATVVTDAKVSTAEIERISVLGKAVNATRDLVNMPPNDLYPQSFAAAAQKAAKPLAVTVQVLDEKKLAAEGYGGIAAVGQGSTRPPRLVKVSYKPRGAKQHIAFVGKGITFDSGGLSLKPGESMVGMKYDMTGAATVLHAVLAIAKLGLPIQATAWLCLAENLPSGSATRPNDVIKIRNGKTVEVLNTDAEGRLVLADGLSAAAEEKPDLIVDVATLTGAATIALGNRYAGLMGDEKAIKAVKSAAESAGELVWHMPLPAELRALLNSEIADIANVKIGNRAGGMLIGGLFLRDFVPAGIDWAHLDIAGPANNAGAAYGFTNSGASGAYIRTLVALAEAKARS